MRRIALALITVLAACGEDDGGGPLTYDNLPSAYANAYCGTLVRCGYVSNINSCRGLDLDFELDPNLTAAVDNGSVLFNETEARECLAGLTGTCESNRLFDDNGHCDLVFVGTVDSGGACQIDEQCISQICNTPTCPDACCPGTCAPGTAPTRPGIGESCASTSQCKDGFCDTATMLCTQYLPTGASCTSSNQCAQGFCGGTCMALPGEGEQCLSGLDERGCNSIGLYCHPSTQLCTPYALEGDSCGDTVGYCSELYVCSGSTCVLRPRLGDPCNQQTSQGDCIDSSYCDPTTGVCTAPKPDGAACDSSSECIGDCDFQTGMCVTDPVCI